MDISPTYTAIRIGNVVDCYHTVPNRIIRDGRPQIRAHNDSHCAERASKRPFNSPSRFLKCSEVLNLKVRFIAAKQLNAICLMTVPRFLYVTSVCDQNSDVPLGTVRVQCTMEVDHNIIVNSLYSAARDIKMPTGMSPCWFRGPCWYSDDCNTAKESSTARSAGTFEIPLA